jgi:Ser/Thr protein kinase RdoA (MazF antagonist)
LTHYDLRVDRLTLLGLYTNTLFRVRTQDGASYVLRLATPGWRTDEDLRAEVLWLFALARDTDIGAPVPVLPRSGQPFVTLEAKGVPNPNRCTILSWIPGTNLGQQLSPETLVKMGELFARLHAHGAAFKPPPDFTQRQMSSYLARGEPDALFAFGAANALDAEHRELLYAVQDRAAAAFAGRYADPEGLRVIHNDLWHDNIKIYRGRLHPLDFEDTLWGYPVQDIAMALQDLMTDVAPAEYAPLAAAFRKGYTSLAPWPEGHDGEIDCFRAGRILWVLNYVARYEREYLVESVARWGPILQRWLDRGRLLREA